MIQLLGNADSSERELAKEHVKNLKSIIDFKKVILVFDAGYYFLELKLFLDKFNLKYIFRLPPNTYKTEINKMNSMDEILKINNTAGRKQNIQDENLLNTAKKLPYIESRIVKIPIINQDDEEDELILLTNLKNNKANTFEIVELYKDRWKIEVNYGRLKNKMEIGNYGEKLLRQ